MPKYKDPNFIRKACSICEKVNTCPREKEMADLCYQSMYNKKVRDKDDERIRQANFRLHNFDKYMFSKTKHMAKKAGIEFTLTHDWFKSNLQRGTCHLTGLEFVKPVYQRGKRGQRGPYTPSVDRIDNSKGYTPDNCRMVIWIVNLAKNSYSESDLARLCKAFTAAEISQQLSIYQNEVSTVAGSVFTTTTQSPYETTTLIKASDTKVDIFSCAEQGDIEGLQACLIFNDDINALKDGRTALFYTTDLIFAKWLIHFGINVDHADQDGMTAVHAAMEAGGRDLAEYLIRVSKRAEWASMTTDQVYRSCERDILRRSAYAVLAQHARQMPMVCQL